MPCRCDDYGNTYSDLKREADKLAEMLCRLCRPIEGAGILRVGWSEVPADIQEWFAKHKEADRKRQAEEMAKRHSEQLKQNALSKLTRDELAALGIRVGG